MSCAVPDGGGGGGDLRLSTPAPERFLPSRAKPGGDKAGSNLDG